MNNGSKSHSQFVLYRNRFRDDPSSPIIGLDGSFSRPIRIGWDEAEQSWNLETVAIDEVLEARRLRRNALALHPARLSTKTATNPGEPDPLLDIMLANEASYFEQPNDRFRELQEIYNTLRDCGFLSSDIACSEFLKRVWAAATDAWIRGAKLASWLEKVEQAAKTADLLAEMECDLRLIADLPPEWWQSKASELIFRPAWLRPAPHLFEQIPRRAADVREHSIKLVEAVALLRQNIASLDRRAPGRPPHKESNPREFVLGEAIRGFQELWRDVARRGGKRRKGMTAPRFIKAAIIATDLQIPVPIDALDDWIAHHLTRKKAPRARP